MNMFEMRLLGLFIPAVRKTMEMHYEFDEPMMVDDRRFGSVFGNHATPFESALAQTLEWVSANVPAGH